MSQPSPFALIAASAVYNGGLGAYQLNLTFNARRASGGISNDSISVTGDNGVAVPAQTRPAGESVTFNCEPSAPGFLGEGPAQIQQVISPSELVRESDNQPCTNVQGFPVPVTG